MNRTTLTKLAIAMAAAGFLAGSATPALSYEVSPEAVMEMAGSFVESGEAENAIALLGRLQALGVTRIGFDGQAVEVADLVELMRSNTPGARTEFFRIVALVSAATNVSFWAGTRIIASVDSEDLLDFFPTSSAG